jgi:uncharacterized protein DUF6982
MGAVTRVVVRYNDGRVRKGTTQDFFPNRPAFHLLPPEGGAGVEVRCRELKAVFFVKTFAGDSQRRDLRGFLAAAPETSKGRKIAVLFRDGELVCGYSLSFLPNRDGFFMFPADAGSNNERIYVVSGSAVEVQAGPAADELVQRTMASEET